MPQTDVSNLLSNANTLILWNEASEKWQNPGNDFFCHQRRDGSGGWMVAARYGFEDGRRDIEFDTEKEAMQFFVNFLFARKMKAIDEHFERRRTTA